MRSTTQKNWQFLLWMIVIVGIATVSFFHVTHLKAQDPEAAADLSAAHCGGWYPFERDPPSVGNFIPSTGEIPGRDGDPLGHVKSGMARRIEAGGTKGDGFLFPDSTRGLSTACRPGGPPWFQEHPCQRPGRPFTDTDPVIGNGNNATPDTLSAASWSCDAICPEMNRRWHKLTWEEYCNVEQEDESIVRGPTGQTHMSACFDEDLDPRPVPPSPPPSAGKPKHSNCSWENERTRYCCSNGLFSTTVEGETVPADEPPNCVPTPCIGADCRNAMETLNGFTTQGGLYISYYRQYEDAFCQRSPIPPPYVDDDDHERIGVPVSCYGMYEEYDPKVRVSHAEDFSCTIANTYPDKDHDFLDMQITQRSNFGAVDYGQHSNWPDPPEQGFDPGRLTTNDVWMPQQGGFATTDKDVLEEYYNSDLTFALLTPDETAFRAYPQLTMEQPISTGGLLRAFDDSVSNDRYERRTIVEWWQEVETVMNGLLEPPALRIIVPAPWVQAIDKEDPFVLEDISSFNIQPEQPESVEIVLQAKEDLLGELAAFFERSQLLQIKEVEIPVVVPLGNPIELRALADAWCGWHMKRSGDSNCDNMPPDVGDMVFRLEEYALLVEDIRKLRADLYHIESAALERQRILLSKMGSWMKETVDKYNEYISSLAQVDSYRANWQNMQAQYQHFHDTTNFPWCMNDRFLVPIYSMLDYDYFPGRPELDAKIDEEIFISGALPRLKVYLPKIDPGSVNQHDVFVDFSNLYTYADSLRIPVLKPTQVRFDWSGLTPPDSIEKSVPPLPPPMPPLPFIHGEVNATMPTMKFNESPPSMFSYIPNATLQIDSQFFSQVENFLTEMDVRYEKFWKSLTLDPAVVIDGTEEDCLSPDSGKCAHVEMDLKERFQRMCARPAIMLKEDWDVRGDEWRNPVKNDYDVESCDRKDWACQILFRNTKHGRKGWWLEYPTEEAQDNFVDTIRGRVFNQTLLRQGVPEDQRFEYIVKPSEIFPSFDIQRTDSPIPEFEKLTPPPAE